MSRPQTRPPTSRQSALALAQAPQSTSGLGRIKWRRRAWAFAFNGTILGSLLFIASGGYTNAVHYRDSRITVALDPGLPIENVSARIGPADLRQINCLAKTLYFEARNQGPEGMKAVSDVVYNRIASGIYPDTICQVVYQGPIGPDGLPLKDRCQFSWYCDGLRHEVTDKPAWALAVGVAYNTYLYHLPSAVGDATAYHTADIHPSRGIWAKAEPIAQVGAHIFYRPSGRFAPTKKDLSQ